MFTACFLFIFMSCDNPKLWGLSRDELCSTIDRGEFAVLESLTDSDYELVSDFDPAAPYALATRLARAGRPVEARKLLAAGVRRCPEPWKSLCASELARSGDASERLAFVESLLSSGDEFLPGVSLGKGALEFMRQDALLELGQFDAVFGSDPAIRNFRVDVWRKSWKTAWVAGKAILSSGSASALSRGVISDLGKAALYGAPDTLSEVALFDRLSDEASGRPGSAGGYMFAFYAGRLSKKGSDGAIARFETARDLAANAVDRDNAIWYSLDARLSKSAASLIDGLIASVPSWGNPAYFTDLLETCVVQLVHDRDWASVARLRAAVPPLADSDLRARLDYLVARSPLTDAESATALLRGIAGDARATLYYRLLADADFAVGDARADRTAGTADASDPLADALRALVSWHLEDCVYPVAAKIYPDCPRGLAVELAPALQKAARYGDAIRLVNMAVARAGGQYTREELEIAYPRPWRGETSSAAKRFGVGEHVLYALIRSESYFDAEAVSSAGAYGLTQLMEPTAADIARKLKVSDFDLSDPGTNISFGARYLSELTERLDGNPMAALWAYNAGITRVREWMKAVPAGDTDLLLEGLPYSETREYGRKVLAAAAVYGYLYYQKPVAETVRELF